MKVLLAKEMGMCFGVRDALDLAKAVESPESVTIFGQLVHNPRVLRDLDARGFSTSPEDLRIVPETPVVMITAHGVSHSERAQLRASGKELVDTTCPLVRKVHDTALRLQEDGYFVVVIGKPGHVEVHGIVGDLIDHVVVETPADVERYPVDRIGVVCQTTTPPTQASAILDSIRSANFGKEILFEDTICDPTRDRQEAVVDLLGSIEALVVVGGRNSNNSRQLGVLAESRGVPCVRVDGPEDLDPAWFTAYQVVGLTAGTSTLDETIESVRQALLAL